MKHTIHGVFTCDACIFSHASNIGYTVSQKKQPLHYLFNNAWGCFFLPHCVYAIHILTSEHMHVYYILKKTIIDEY